MQAQDIELDYRKVNDQITRLLDKLFKYIKTRFAASYPIAETVNEETILRVIAELFKEEAKTKPAGGLLSTVASYTVTPVASAVAKVSGNEIPFHRLPHLQYFAEQALALRASIQKLDSLAKNSAFIDESIETEFAAHSNNLTTTLSELFNTTQFLISNYSSVIQSTKAGTKSFDLPGMKGGRGGSKLAEKINEILETNNPQQLASLIQTVKQNSINFKAKRQKEREALAREKTAVEQRAKKAAQEEQDRLEAEHRAALKRKDDAVKALTAAATKSKNELDEAKQHLQKNEEVLQEKEQILQATQQQHAEAVQSKAELHAKFSLLAEESRKLGELGKDGMNALHRAILKNDAAQVQVLLKTSHVDPNKPTAKGQSPLALAFLNDTGELKSHVTKETISIVSALLEKGANANELNKDEKRTFVHMLAFKRNKHRKEAYELREKPQLELIELLLLHGCRLDIGATAEDITNLLANNKNQSLLAKLLRTFNLYSVKQLADLYNTEQTFRRLYETLTARSHYSASAQAELAVIKPYFDRYHCVLELFLCRDSIKDATSRYQNRLACAAEIEKIPVAQRTRDMALMQECMQTMSKKFDDIRREKNSTTLRLESAEEETATYSCVKQMAECVFKCIEKLEAMYTVRYQPDETQRYALTSLESILVDKRLPEVKAKLETEREEETKMKQKMTEKKAGLK